MYKIGDYIIHGTNGVCEVVDVGPLDSPVAPADKIYYTLTPVFKSGSKIYTPADNIKVIMRPIITKEEADNIIKDINDIEVLWISDERKREFQYKEAFQSCDCIELVKIIKTIYLRKQSRLAQGKKVTVSDDKYFHMAEDSLYGELSFAMNMDKDKVKDYIMNQVEEEQ